MEVYRESQGFTLIELVIVIVILGILAAVALPKYVDLTGQARIASNQGFAGALASSVHQTHVLWLGTNNPSTVTIEGGTIVHMNSVGWPDGIGAAAQASNAGCVNIWSNLMQNPVTAVAGAAGCGSTTPCYNAVYAAGPPATCVYTVNNFTNIRVEYVISGTGAGGVIALSN